MGEKIFSVINQEEIEECYKVLKKGGFNTLKTFLENKMDEWKTIPLNIGIIGNTGSGKSSCINATRGLSADDEGAAKVDVVETTTEPTPFPHQNNNRLIFWDLPGVGAPNFPRKKYLKKIGFERFDFFLIVTCTRFTDNDIWLANEITHSKKRFFFVRTKINLDVTNDQMSHPKTHSAEKVLKNIKNNIKINLGSLYADQNVFLIDNYNPMMYDFQELGLRIIEDFPDLKRDALILSLSTLNEEMVKKKAQTLRKRIWMVSLASGSIACVPFPGTSIAADTVLIAGQTEYFHNQLGLDKKSLSRLAYSTFCDVNILQDIVDRLAKDLLTIQGLVGFIRALPLCLAAVAAEEGSRLIPVIGLLAASAISFSTTYFILYTILEELERIGLEVVRTAVKNTSDNRVNTERKC